MDLIKRRYDRNYHENLIYREAENSQRNRARLEALAEVAPSGRLLEVGCGKGGFLHLAEQRYDVEGIDVSKYAIRKIARHFGNRVRVSNIERHSLPAARYDAIAVFNLLEHLHAPEKSIKRLNSALKPGGVLIGSMPNNSGLVGGLVTRLGNFFDHTHVSTYPPEVWRQLFEHSGFKDICFFGEITIGRNRCIYIRGNSWAKVSFNLMFTCRK